jgi:hypothetical protein
MKLAIAFTVLMCLSATTAMACSYNKSAQNTPPVSSQQASNGGQQTPASGSQGTTQPRTN